MNANYLISFSLQCACVCVCMCACMYVCVCVCVCVCMHGLGGERLITHIILTFSFPDFHAREPGNEAARLESFVSVQLAVMP